jgi:fermentation-respiration switch protein FrsA (DUF1100 family)
MSHSPVRRLLKILLALPVLAYLIVMGLLVYLEPQLVFPRPEVPREELAARAQAAGAEEVELVTADGVTLYGWRLRGRGERAVLYFSGNGSTVGGPTLLYERLTRAGLDVLHVNYRGYPGSGGEPDEEGLRADARAAWGLLREEFEPDEITVIGRSLGGGVAVGLAAEVRPRALITLATFTAAVDVARESYPWLPVKWLMRNPFDSMALAPRVACPVLLIHGTQDSYIKPHHAEALAAAFAGPAEVLWVPGEDHNSDLLGDPEVLERVLALAR